MKKGLIVAFVFMILLGNLFIVSAQDSSLTINSETNKQGFVSSFAHWIANIGDTFWENVKSISGQVFDAIRTPSSSSSGSSSSSSSSSSGTAYNQLQNINSGGWS